VAYCALEMTVFRRPLDNDRQRIALPSSLPQGPRREGQRRHRQYHDRQFRAGRLQTNRPSAQSAIHSGVVFRIGVLDFVRKQREFHGLHHHRYRFSRSIVSQTGLGCGGDQKGH
jgi:hypothetical protein